jgi:major vault protein
MGDRENQPAIIRLNPTQYAHILDNNTNVTRVLIGPKTLARQEHEMKVFGPEEMILVPPRHYCLVANPVCRDGQGEVLVDSQLQVQLAYGEEEVRTEGPPFPLYPGEVLKEPPTPLTIVPALTALRLSAIRDFTDAVGVAHVAGDEWHFVGPATYIPRVECRILDTIRATIVKPGTALKIRARQEMKDSKGILRQAGEEWLMRSAGAYLPGVYEILEETIFPIVLTEQRAIHLRAARTFTDEYGITRRAGEEWLLTIKECETHVCDVHEEIINAALDIVTLSRNQFCVVRNPWDNANKPQMGKLELRRGEMAFFLKPNEELVGGTILDVIVLAPDEAILLRCNQPFKDGEIDRTPGDRWTVVGPCEYVPPVEVEIVKKYSAIPLDETEGIYVRNIKTGAVETVIGRTYLLGPEEELWEKQLSSDVERLLSFPQNDSKGMKLHENMDFVPEKRDKTKVVAYRTPHNSAIQIYDYRQKTSRVVWGPGLVMLQPDEQFTILSLSGGKPKKQNQIHSLSLSLGPDFMTDVVIVETSDHARLQIQLSYNWFFDINRSDAEDAAKIFQVPDFVGDACKAIASRVRGAVASSTFDDFHKNSSEIIRYAVFGRDENGNIKERFVFPSNKLVITNIDIQSVEPVDQRTREALSASVQQAIEITTKSQEAAARHDAERKAQEAEGLLERQKLKDEIEAEKARKALLELQAESSAVQSSGHAKAEARARAEAASIEIQARVESAKLEAQARKIIYETEIEETKLKQDAELAYERQKNDLEVKRLLEMSRIETEKFKMQVETIGPETIKSIAQAGPEMQAKLLAGLGLNSVLITDGNSPINLFNTAKGLMGQNGNVIDE